MTTLQLLAFAGAMFIFAATPGPGVFATVARAMASGFRASAMVALGIICGDLVFLLFALFGLAAVAALLGGLFVVVKYAGALYLIWLGIKIWRSAPASGPKVAAGELSGPRNVLSGLLITLGNPKAILFYLSFLPTFVDLASLTGRDILLVVLTITTVLSLVLLGYGLLAAKAGAILAGERSRQWSNRCAGTVMAGTGAYLLAKSG